MRVLVLNSGSSSQKSALYELGEDLTGDPPPALWRADIEWSVHDAKLRVQTSNGGRVEQSVPVGDRQNAIARMLETLWNGPTAVIQNAGSVDIVGHRIVHGGHKLDAATVVTPEVKGIIARVAAFAPLHNRAELEGIEIVERIIGPVKQVAVFDTGFHRTLPLPAAVYPGPYEWFEQGIRRYGFHGINHQYCCDRAAQLLDRDRGSMKLVSCHLGNGCSLAAIDGGRSVDTTMGFTPLDGLMMGTRSGSVDPSILTYLMRQGTMSGQDLDDVLNKNSGLLGISGIASDMREILAAAREGNDRAKLAFDIFVHRLQSGMASMAASLGGMDVLVFTAGIGEHSPEVRAASCEQLRFLGIELDPDVNAQSPADHAISTAASRVKVLIIRAQEDWAIAKACKRLSSES
ncbi:MAG TPA: acetate kinase [Terriglobales bacterium]|nr:acetate kinase [Terriglobales bacterium]